MLTIVTDAGYKDGYSSHHYYVMQNGQRIKKRTFLGTDDTSMKAESTTILKALRDADNKGWYNFKLITDAKEIVRQVNKYLSMKRSELMKNLHEFTEEVKHIAHWVKVTGAELVWNNRNEKTIQKAHRECSKMLKTKMRRLV